MEIVDKELLEKYDALKEYMRSLGSVAVAFSSGVDSTFLLYASKEALGDHAIAVTASSCSFPKREPGPDPLAFLHDPLRRLRLGQHRGRIGLFILQTQKALFGHDRLRARRDFGRFGYRERRFPLRLGHRDFDFRHRRLRLCDRLFELFRAQKSIPLNLFVLPSQPFRIMIL